MHFFKAGGQTTGDGISTDPNKGGTARFSAQRARGKLSGTLSGLLNQTAKGSLDSKRSSETDGVQAEPDRAQGSRGFRLGSGVELRNTADDLSSTGSRVSETLVTDASLSLALPIVSFGGSRLTAGLSPAHQPSWKGTKKSRIADIKVRYFGYNCY